MGNLLGGSGGGSSSTTTVQQLDPQIKQAYLSNLDRATNVANNLGSINFAPRTGDYTAGEGVIRNASLSGPGFNTIDQAANTASRLQNTGPMFIGAPQANTALTGASGYNAMFGNAAQLNGADIANYMNPFTRNVIDSTLSDLNRSRQMALNDNNATAIRSGAFGGSRAGVERARTQEAFDRTAASTIANLYNTSFNNAQNAAQQDVSNRQATMLANLGFGNQANQFNATAQNTANLANQSALNNMGQFNANLNMQANQANQNAFQNNLAQQLNAANLANTVGQTQQTVRANAGQNLMNLGLAQQQFSQEQLNAIRNLPLERQAVINQALGLNPAGGSGNTSNTTGSSNQSQGTGIMGLFR